MGERAWVSVHDRWLSPFPLRLLLFLRDGAREDEEEEMELDTKDTISVGDGEPDE